MLVIELYEDTISYENENIYGSFHFKDNNFVFPSNDWNDFIVIVFCWWSDSLINIFDKKKYIEELMFMDGDFRIRIEHFEDNFLNLFFIEGDLIKRKIKVDRKEFLSDFLKNSNLLLRHINQIGIQDNNDIKCLTSNYSLLHEIIKKETR